MTTRRQTLRAIGHLAFGTCWACCWPSSARADRVQIACTSNRPSDENLVLVNTNNIASAQVSSSGSSSLDRAIRAAVTDCYSTFALRPAFYFVVDDPVYSMNAFATQASARYAGLVGEVGFGIPFLNEALRVDPTGYTAMYVIAHEFGHVAQFNFMYNNTNSIYEFMSQNQTTSRLTELHADFIAGVYIGDRYVRNPSQDLSILMKTIHGDNNTTSPGHHGTTSERVKAFRAGYQARLQKSDFNAQVLRDLSFQGAAQIRHMFG